MNTNQTNKTNLVFKKTPATLQTISAANMHQCDHWYFVPLNCFHFCRRVNKPILDIVEHVYGCNYFQFYLVNSFDDLDFGDVDCSERVNTFGALILSEFEPIYFKFLHKIVFEQNYHCQIPISVHFYTQLFESGIIHKLLLAKYVSDLSSLLLQLSGDVETNPGPSYKELCKKDRRRKQISKSVKERKEQIVMNRELKMRENEDFAYLRNIDKVQAQMQISDIFGTIASFGSNIYMGRQASKTLNKVNNVCDILTDEVVNTLQQFRSTFSEVKQFLFKGFNVIDLVGDIMMGLLQISFAKPGYKLASLSIELFRLLTKYGLSQELLDNMRNLVHPYFDKVNASMQIETDFLKAAGEVTPTHIVVFLLSILSAIFMGSLPKVTQIESVLKRIGDISRSTTNIVNFNNTVHSLVAMALDEFKINFLGIRPKQEIEDFVSGIDRWFDETRSLLTRVDEWKKSDQILKDPETIIEVESLYKRGLEFSKDIADKKLQRELQLPFQVHMRMLSDLMKMVDTSGAFGTRPRTQPVVIWLYGESGVGKSGMSWPLAVDLNNMFVHNEQEAKEFSKNIYMRNVEQEFWDNYQGQNVVIYDDFGQRVDSSTKPNEEFMELIRTANIAPYPLHMAHLEDKRKTRFTSKVLLMTSNVFEQNVYSLTFPDAFRRRIDLCAKITNKPEYTKVGYSAQTGKTVQRLNKKMVQLKTGEIISTDVYDIELVDPESGASLEVGLSYEEFLDRAMDSARDAFDSSRRMNDFLERYAQSRFRELKANMSKNNVEHVEAEMQINEKSFIFQYDFLEGKTFEEICDLADSGNIVRASSPEHFISKEDIMAELYDEYLDLNDFDIELDYWRIQRIYELYRYRETKLYRRLKNAKDHALKSIKPWYEAAIKQITEHPFVVASTVLLTISTIFLASRFWTKIVGKPSDNCEQRAEMKLLNVNVKPYTGEEARDLSNLNQSQLMEVLPTILADTVAGTTMALILRKPYPLIMGMISGMCGGLTVYIKNRFFSWHGKDYELIPTIEASVSGDPNTIKPKLVHLEASAPGDSNTLSVKKIVIEANPSGDQITMSRVRPFVEASASADCITLKPRAPIIEASVDVVPADMQMWKDQVAQNIITNRIFSNLYKIGKIIEGDRVQPLLHGLFVRNNIMLVPGHLCGFLKQEDEIEIRNSFDVAFRLPWDKIRRIPVLDACGEAKEAVLLSMPNYVSAHSDLVKHFSNGESMGKYRKADTCLPLLRYSEKFSKFLMYILGTQEATARDRPLIINDKDKQSEFMIREGLTYKAPTTSGDCGAPVIINETQVLRKIAGIHVAGARDGTAYAESITQKDLERSFEKIDASMQIKVDFDEFCSPPQLKEEIPLNTEFSEDSISFCDLPGSKFLPVGRVSAGIFEPGKTEIRPSLVFGKISEIKTKPAILRDQLINGERINMKHRNLVKCAMDTPYIDDDLIDRAYELVKQKWLSGRDKRLAKVLSWEECIQGSPDSEYLGPINRSSSPGYPWILNRPKGMKGKTGWFGDQEYILSKEVEDSVNFRISEAKAGRRVPTVWIDTLKDERRPIAKVDAFKTRVFSNGPMDYSIAFRKYFLGFIAHLMENRIQNEVSIGTNVYSQDWKQTAMKLLSKGRKVIAGDFSTFDGTLNSCLMAKFVDLANEFYSDGPENALIRTVLFKDVYNSVHLCNDSVYMMTHSQPSGNPATTPLNCFINSMSLRIVFELCAKMIASPLRKLQYTMADFDKHVSIVSYGDDNVINFSDTVAPWFNMATITTAFDELGMIYTDEMKSERGTAPLWRSLDEVAYLKRSFRYDVDKRVWEAPLCMDTILEMPNWCRGELDIEEGTKVNCENAIMELSLHPRHIFEKWSKHIADAFYEATGNQLCKDTYHGYHRKRFMEYYV